MRSFLSILGHSSERKRCPDQPERKVPVVALAGNPNTGKSTVFNALTGLRQHTGNWPGKTVGLASGPLRISGSTILVVDLPGTYSLLAASEEERIARDFICSGTASAIVVVVDATCLERNLNLVLQVLEITDSVILCVNLVDEARRKGIHVDKAVLSRELGVPVVLTAARSGEGLDQLKNAILHSVNRGESAAAKRSALTRVKEAMSP
ncbi:MAG: FeoB small GTPase domain-containing protein [Bacillota bacterium]|jgi:ferrous iron transport protein B|nr:iron transporter FeoB [Bacillota bacterium]